MTSRRSHKGGRWKIGTGGICRATKLKVAPRQGVGVCGEMAQRNPCARGRIGEKKKMIVLVREKD